MKNSLTYLAFIFIGLVLLTCIEDTSARSLKSCKAHPKPPIEIEEPPKSECRKNGCIGDICSDEQVDYMCAASTLDDPPENNCWLQSFAICERQANGNCGWTYNDELNECNADYADLVANWVPPKPIERVVIEEPKLPCLKSGCTGDVCTDQQIDYMCVAPSIDDPPGNTCWLQSFAICERQTSGECGWTSNDELNKCNADYAEFVANWVPPKPIEPEPVVVEDPKPPCVKSGCIGDVCTDKQIDYMCAAASINDPPGNTCWLQSFAICERQTSGECGWTSNDELNKCNNDYAAFVANWVPPKPIEPVVVAEPKPPCVKSGCIGEVCSEKVVNSICAAPGPNDPPQNTCWKQSFATCKRQSNGKCGWTSNVKLNKCNADYTKLVANWVPPKSSDDEDHDIDLDLDFDY